VRRRRTWNRLRKAFSVGGGPVVNGANDISELVNGFHDKNDALKTDLESTSKKIGDAVATVKRSWSGSFAGWHGNMYFLDFQQPGHHERFSSGVIEGVPPGWYEQKPDAVRKRLEELVGSTFSFEDFEQKTEQLRTETENLKDDTTVALSSVPTKSLTDGEQKMLSELEGLSLGEDKDIFVYRGLPSQIITNDIDAVAEGTCIPSWLYYYAVALEAESLCKAIDTFLRLTERISRQLDGRTISKTDSTDLHPVIVEKCFQLYLDKHYSEAAEKSFKVVKDRLRDLTGYEKAHEAFGSGLYIKGAAASNVDEDFNRGVQFLAMAIDRFKNEKGHTADGNISDPMRAYQYLAMSSLAMSFLDNTEIRKPTSKKGKGQARSV
jgi:uncharacterized protein (TIGR02391 family)